MNPTVVIWILAAVVAVLVGREVGKRLFDANAKVMAKKRAAQAGVDVRVYDIDENPAVAKQYEIAAVPTYIFYLCGRKPLRTNDANEVLTIIRNGWGCR